jgi:spermidine synthase
MNPKSVAAHTNLGNVLQAMGRIEEAIAEWETSLRLNPDSAPAHNNLAGNLYSLGRFRDAVEHWHAGLRLEPNRLTSLRQLAWALATCPDPALRNGSEAVSLAEKARQLSEGRDPAVLSTLAAAYAELGRFSEALETAKGALALAREQNVHPLTEALQGWIPIYERGIPLRERR